MTKIQSILFAKNEWTLRQAKTWLRSHGYKTVLDNKPKHYRFRQLVPIPGSGYSTATIEYKNREIELILMY